MTTKKHMYIMVADSGRAKIFRAVTPLTSLEAVFDQVNFQGRKSPSEIYSDRPGRQQTDSRGSHGFAADRDPHEQERFSRELCKYLADEHNSGRFDTLVLVAPPHFLGELRKHLDKQCQGALLSSIDKDLVRMPVGEIIGRILAENPELGVPGK